MLVEPVWYPISSDTIIFYLSNINIVDFFNPRMCKNASKGRNTAFSSAKHFLKVTQNMFLMLCSALPRVALHL
jgi:hypothetical protein